MKAVRCGVYSRQSSSNDVYTSTLMSRYIFRSDVHVQTSDTGAVPTCVQDEQVNILYYTTPYEQVRKGIIRCDNRCHTLWCVARIHVCAGPGIHGRPICISMTMSTFILVLEQTGQDMIVLNKIRIKTTLCLMCS